MIKKIYNFILDLLFPTACVWCGKEGSYLCEACALKIESRSPVCFICEKRSPDGKICQICQTKTKLRRFFSGYHYQNEILKEAIHKFKYNFVKDLDKPLGGLLLNFLQGYFPKDLNKEKTIIIPVPLSKQRLNWRGFNQSELLAKIVADNFLIPLETKILIRIKNTIPQAQIKNRGERIKNIQGVFALKNPEMIKNKIIILIDDISTTGATMEECAKILKTNGAKQVWAITLARG